MLLHLILAYDLCMPSCAFPAGLVRENIPVPVYTVRWILLHGTCKRHPCCQVFCIVNVWLLCKNSVVLSIYWRVSVGILRINFGMAFSHTVLKFFWWSRNKFTEVKPAVLMWEQCEHSTPVVSAHQPLLSPEGLPCSSLLLAHSTGASLQLWMQHAHCSSEGEDIRLKMLNLNLKIGLIFKKMISL